jgi:hypothetical protein
MISPEAIRIQLNNTLPFLTTDFSNNQIVTANIIAGTPQTLSCYSSGHGLTNGQNVLISNSLIDNSITDVSGFTDTDGTSGLRFTTDVEHDLTMSYPDNLNSQDKIELQGFTDITLNGYFILYAVPSDNTFEIVFNGTTPVLTGVEVLREIRQIGIDGTWPVSIVDQDNFNIVLKGSPQFSILPVPKLNCYFSFRIKTAADFLRSEQLYTAQATGKYYAFIIMEDCRASKSRESTSDAMSENTANSSQRTRTLNRFSIDVFIPTRDEISGSIAINYCWTTMLQNILNCLQGIQFNTFDNSNFVTNFVMHGSVKHVNAYYVHAYTFEYVYDISVEQSALQKFTDSRALREIKLSFDSTQNGSEIDLT